MTPADRAERRRVSRHKYRVKLRKRKQAAQADFFRKRAIDPSLYQDPCEICDVDPGVTLAQDHDHQTGQKRGRLCMACNVGLGHFKDRANLLRKAADYLDHWQQTGPNEVRAENTRSL